MGSSPGSRPRTTAALRSIQNEPTLQFEVRLRGDVQIDLKTLTGEANAIEVKALGTIYRATEKVQDN